jgi:hypothetical protein
MKRISYVLAALAAIAVAAPAVAQDKPMMKGGMHGGMHHRMHHRMMWHHEGRGHFLWNVLSSEFSTVRLFPCATIRKRSL